MRGTAAGEGRSRLARVPPGAWLDARCSSCPGWQAARKLPLYAHSNPPPHPPTHTPAEMVELDLHLTAEGEVVVHHDFQARAPPALLLACCMARIHTPSTFPRRPCTCNAT